MKIIILGAGQVGGTLAENLASEKNDITVVDIDNERLGELQDRIDIGVINGPASHPSTLEQAGAKDADLLIAVTNSDEINIVACQIAYTIFHTPKRIARVRATAYLDKKELFNDDNIPINVIISPELLVTHYIHRLVQNPGALQVLDFAEGKVQLVAIKAYYGGPIVGEEIQAIRDHMPNIDTRVAAIYRRGQTISPEANTIIEAGDEVFFIVDKEHIKPVMNELRRMDNPCQRILIAGGGNIGQRLASLVEKDYIVKVIEQSYDRCRDLAENLQRTIVLHGNSSDKDLLIAEGIEEVDMFCALTNDDEANIMSSMLAKRLGAKKVITLITNPAYVDLVQGGDIDIAISPQQITIGSLLTHVRRGDISKVHSLRRGAAEAIELIAHGDAKSSKVIGRRLDELKLPAGVTIGAIVRGEQVLIAHGHIIVEPDDHIIMFLTDKSKIKKVEQLFAVGFGFF